MPDFEIDLDDGLPPGRVTERRKAPRPNSAQPARFAAPPAIQETKIPTAILISYTPVRCLGCGAEHRTHTGIFLESRVGAYGGKVMERKMLRELPSFAGLPRRVDIGPPEVIPICIDCWQIQRAFQEAVDVALMAQAEGGPSFGEPARPSPLNELAHELKQIHETQEGELDDFPLPDLPPLNPGDN